MRDKLIIDTSIWIAYFQARPPVEITSQVDDLLAENDIHIPKIVLAELIQGAHSEKDLAILLDFLDAFRIIGEQESTWLEAGQLAYKLKKKGKTVNLADCYIAVLARENSCGIFTLDKHFKEIQKEIGFKLIPVHP
jgi:predicted nucleic acid-binding protein